VEQKVRGVQNESMWVPKEVALWMIWYLWYFLGWTFNCVEWALIGVESV